MKKIVVTGLLALGVLALTQQQASAWINAKFGVGLNLGWQSGGNQVLWGAWSNGQVPGPEAFGGGYMPSYAGPPPVIVTPPPQPYAPPHGYAPHGSFAPPAMAPSHAGQYAPPFQFANYPRPATYYYYPTPYYYYGR